MIPLDLRFWRYFIICFLLSFSVFAQENFLETYHPYRNKAEMAIVADDYKTASQHYATAFKSVKNPLAKDIFNAMACNLLIDDFETAKKYLIKLAGKGISDELLFELKIFENEKFTLFFEKNRMIYRAVQELTLKDKLGDLRDKRQILQDVISKIFKKNNGNFEVEYNGLIAFYHHINKEGIVSEEETFLIDAINHKNNIDSDEEEFIYTKNQLDLNTNASADFINQFRFLGMPETKEDSTLKLMIDKKLIEAVKNGIINPHYAIKKTFGHSEKHDFFKTTVITLSFSNDSNCTFYKDKQYVLNVPFTGKPYQDYEELKNIFGLESLEEKREKEKYAFSQNLYFIFPTKARFEVLSVIDCDAAQKELLGYILLEKK